MLDRLVGFSVRVRRLSLFRVLMRTLVVLFPLALVGSVAEVVKDALLNSNGVLYNILRADRWISTSLMQILRNCCNALQTVTLGSIGLFAGFAAAKYTARLYHKDSQMAGLTAIVVELLIAYRFQRITAVGMFNIEWRLFSYHFLSVGLLVGFCVGQVYRLCGRQGKNDPRAEHALAVKQRSYDAMLPFVVSCLIGLLFGILFNLGSYFSVFSDMNVSLQDLAADGNSVVVKAGMVMLSSLLDWLGLNGIYTFNIHVNSTAMATNLSYVLSHGSSWNVPHRFIASLIYQAYAEFGGSGVILALLIALMIVNHDHDINRLGRWTFLPVFFNVSPAAMIGLPVILNPFYLLPMLFVPLVNMGLAVLAIMTHLVPALAYPTMTRVPALLFGFMATNGNVMTIILSLLLLLIDVILYVPFVKIAKIVEKRVIAIDQEGDRNEIL